MDYRHRSRTHIVLGLVVGLLLWSIPAPAAAKKPAPDGWESVQFDGNYMWYEATLGETEADLSWLYVQIYDGDFTFDKRTTRSANLVIVRASGGGCFPDDGSYGTETGYVMVIRQLAGSQVNEAAIAFDDPRAGSLDATLAVTGTRAVWEAEYHGPGSCDGVAILEEQPIPDVELDIGLGWSSERTVVLVQKGGRGKTTEEVRWVTSVDTASGTLGGMDLSLPFGTPDWDLYWAQSLPASSSKLIPAGTFD